MPLRADATGLQMSLRRLHLAPSAGNTPSAETVAREFAAACVDVVKAEWLAESLARIERERAANAEPPTAAPSDREELEGVLDREMRESMNVIATTTELRVVADAVLVWLAARRPSTGASHV
jgi:hypothetical protein